MGALVRLYVDRAGGIERRHIDLRHRAEEHGLPATDRVADRAYAGYANGLNQAFFEQVARDGALEVPGVPQVTARLEQPLWKAKGRRAVVIVDALRYDCALGIKDLLRGHTVSVEPMLAVMPTITPIGMTALLPLAGATIELEVKDNGLHPKVNGRDMAVREN